VSKNVRIFGRAPKYDERNIWPCWRPRIKIAKASGYFASVFALTPSEWNIFIYLSNIGRICYKENHHVNSLDLNGPKIHAIYLVELQNIYEMMA